MNQARFQKQQREKARREKAAAKWARRAERAEQAADGAPEDAASPEDQDVVLAELADLHQRFEAGTIPFEDFEESKDRLMERLRVQ